MRPLIFDPPRIAIDADLQWVLCAAFSHVRDPRPPNDPRRAIEMARATQLSGRIAARLGSFRKGAAPHALTEELSNDYYGNVVKETFLVHALEQIKDVAERLAIPVIAAKFAGLRLAGVLAVGARPASDLDVLLPKSSAREFWRALLAIGFRKTNTHEYPHQLEALLDPYGAFVDVHVHLPGVVVQTGSFATAEQLLAHGLLSGTHGVLVPKAQVLAAHAIAHGLVQNRSTPQTYSPLRLLSDLMDLRRLDRQVVSTAAHYLAPQLGATCATLERLCAYLEEGLSAQNFDGTSEQALLWHCLAARLDSNYAERLRAAGLANKFSDGSSAVDIAWYIGDLLYPAEAALDYLYGPAQGTFARIRRRVRRPLDLVVRAARRLTRGAAR